MRNFFLLFILFISFQQCALPQETANQSVQAYNNGQGNNAFILNTKESLYLSNVDLKIRFLGVTQDSRCPKDVQCVWPGNARIKLQVNEELFTLDTQDLKSNNYTKSKSVNGFTYTLLQLYPEKTSDKEISEYAIRLKIEKDN